jgi:opacity protein-like surface antigen
MTKRGAWVVLACLFVPSVAAADVGGRIEVFGGEMIPRSGNTSGDLDYVDEVEASPQLGVRVGPVLTNGHLFAGFDASVDHTWYRDRDPEVMELTRLRVLAGARIGYASERGALLFARGGAGLDRVTADFHRILEACGDRSSDDGFGWELGGGAGYRRGHLDFVAEVAAVGGRHRDHRPFCGSFGEVDVLDYDSVDVDVRAGVAYTF